MIWEELQVLPTLVLNLLIGDTNEGRLSFIATLADLNGFVSKLYVKKLWKRQGN